MTWYYIDESITDGERRKGPYHLDEIRDLVQEKKITDDTLVWHSGLENFVPWKEMEESKATYTSAEDEELLKKTIEELLAQQVAQHKTQKRYAGFFTRGLAFAIDNIILTLTGLLMMQVLGVLQIIDPASIDQVMETIANSGDSAGGFSEILDKMLKDPSLEILFMICSIIQALYFIFFTAIKGATPGKMLLHIKVETSEGGKVRWLTSIIRYIASMFTQFTLALYGIGYIIVMIDPKRRALHDHIARTRVVIEYKIKVRPVSEVNSVQTQDENNDDHSQNDQEK
ncbi:MULTISPECIES: RDD family protein [unclassified Fibrobacter]|uniref:RDD family protein n=1 Tax=unclassified Fibrobacter TaxID=2634177 RepID=UPI000D6CB76D|nr:MULTISPECIES: RDD family protein [unclassified Fibrobacter]PWJ68209.1 putative RDD family membrane protein YckC [Fibrobacter sp. UWR4]PZW72567.1 putative RDD family membrane protein YckC [Fibrobacter sp. UWR1]